MRDVCGFGCCTREVAALPDGGWSLTDKGWALDIRRHEHVRREREGALARVDRFQADLPQCRACGQRALRLDAFGLCSKTTEAHKARRSGLTFAPAGRRR